MDKIIENAVRESFALSRMIGKSSQPITKRNINKDCILKTGEILKPEKRKIFEIISLSPYIVTSDITDSVSNSYLQLTITVKEFEKFSIALD